MKAVCVMALALLPLLTARTFAGEKPVWPESLRRDPARVVRLNYARGVWEEDKADARSGDRNLLLWYHVVSGLPIADSSYLKADALRQMKDAELPPFLLIAGAKRIQLTDSEVATLRWYCLEKGGMLIASANLQLFDTSFREFLTRCFPNGEVADIPNTAALYQGPFPMPNGAPPLWHHAGRRARGVRMDDRWVVFYHRGGLTDGWKDRHMGSGEPIAIAAYKMGFNLLHYAYSQQDAGSKNDEQPAEELSPAAAQQTKP